MKNRIHSGYVSNVQGGSMMQQLDRTASGMCRGHLARFVGCMVPSLLLALSSALLGCMGDDQLPTPTYTPTPELPTDQDLDGDGYSIDEGDCKELDASYHPGASEVIYGADGKDQDCDGVADNGTPTYDDDGDGYSEEEGDCVDSDASIYPDAPEPEDGIDNNCNYGIDEPILIFGEPSVGTVTTQSASTFLLEYARVGQYGSYQTDLRILPDMDGDGIDEIATGMFEDDIAGRVYVVYGPDAPSKTSTALEKAAQFGIEGIGSPDLTGIELGGGDLDGDGLGDLLVGDPIHHRIAFFRGGARRTGMLSTSSADALFTPIESGAWSVGLRFDVPGDLNGDGFDDLVIGQPAYDRYRGRALIFFGGRSFSGAIDVEQADLQLVGEEEFHYAGCNVSGVGDMDGDGYPELLVNAKYAVGNGGLPQGKLYLIWGASALMSSGVHSLSDATLQLVSQFPSDVLRISYGDHNGDGFDDMALSFILGHRVLIVLGGSARLEGEVFVDGLAESVIEPDIPELTSEALTGATLDWSFGASISLRSDLNRDGFSDLVVGSPYLMYVEEAWVDEYGTIYVSIDYLNGFATVFPGRSNPEQWLRPGVSSSLRLTSVMGTMEDVWFVASGGDVTGDGMEDLLIGADVWLEEVKEDYTDYIMTHHTLVYSGADFSLPQ